MILNIFIFIDYIITRLLFSKMNNNFANSFLFLGIFAISNNVSVLFYLLILQLGLKKETKWIWMVFLITLNYFFYFLKIKYVPMTHNL